jgi:hypothetical protein
MFFLRWIKWDKHKEYICVGIYVHMAPPLRVLKNEVVEKNINKILENSCTITSYFYLNKKIDSWEHKKTHEIDFTELEKYVWEIPPVYVYYFYDDDKNSITMACDGNHRVNTLNFHNVALPVKLVVRKEGHVLSLTYKRYGETAERACSCRLTDLINDIDVYLLYDNENFYKK